MTTDTANNAAAKPDAEGLRRTLEDAIHAYDKTISEWETAVKPPDDIMMSIRDFLKITLTREGAVALLDYVARLEAALKFYADEKTYELHYDPVEGYGDYQSIIEHDGGKIAREVLAPQAEAVANDHATGEG